MRINLGLNEKDTRLLDLMFYSYPKQLDAMIILVNIFFNSLIFVRFFKEFSSAHQACFYLILNTAKAVIL